MAKLRVFISSTFYDLRHVRSSIEGFVERMGYEPILSEKGKIAYDPDMPLDESCYREASSADIFVLIIGGRYGSAASAESVSPSGDFYTRYESITKQEYESAVRREIPIYVLIEGQVMSEFETYKKNKLNQTIEYAHVDSINVFQFIDRIFKQVRNNPIHQFHHYMEIENWLREQWSGFFKELIRRKSENRQLHSLNGKVAELASINESLQRYLEEVVRVSSPERGEELIKSEKKKILEEKTLRKFSDVKIINELNELADISIESLIEIFSTVSTFEELGDSLNKASSLNIVPEDVLTFWKTAPEAVANINLARTILGKSELVFSGKFIY